MPAPHRGDDNPLAERFKRVLQVLADRLKPHGFRKRGQHYLRPTEKIICAISVYRSRYSHRRSMSFSSQAGPFVPGFWSIYTGTANMVDSPSAPGAPLDETLGYLARGAGGGWTEMTDSMGDDEVEAIAADFAERHVRHVLPWLAQFDSIADVARFLERPIDSPNPWRVMVHRAMDDQLRRAAACHFVAGDDAACLAALDRALAECARSPHYATLPAYRDRLRAAIEKRRAA
jgi:hypothetical protein